MLAQRLAPLFLLLSLAACEQLSDALDLPDPKKTAALAEAEGKAIGSACRQTGRSLEDCYALNAKVQKAAIFAGWREMNDYMMQNNLPEVPSQMAHSASGGARSGTPAPTADVAPQPDNRNGPRPRNGH
jgi:hypothetical protein